MTENQSAVPEPDPLNAARASWDAAAPSFDDEPDHGLRDPQVRAAWAERLRAWLPDPAQTVLDIGCGTGSLSVLLAGMGHRVSGVDLSPAMIALARQKAAHLGLAIPFEVMDAARLRLRPQSFDALLCRHLLWALPEPDQVLARWAKLLRPDGRLILIEGFWHTGAGLRASQVSALIPPTLRNVQIENLSAASSLWGGPVSDERYALLATRV